MYSKVGSHLLPRGCGCQLDPDDRDIDSHDRRDLEDSLILLDVLRAVESVAVVGRAVESVAVVVM